MELFNEIPNVTAWVGVWQYLRIPGGVGEKKGVEPLVSRRSAAAAIGGGDVSCEPVRPLLLGVVPALLGWCLGGVRVVSEGATE